MKETNEKKGNVRRCNKCNKRTEERKLMTIVKEQWGRENTKEKKNEIKRGRE